MGSVQTWRGDRQNYLCVAAVELPVTVSEMAPEEAAKEELPA
jgi:hypothetical protein